MARRYRRRLFRRRRGLPRSRKAKMARIKRDILRCNFPTKVKFLGLTEKKVMYLTNTFTKDLNNGFSFYLCPLDTENISSIMDFSKTINEKECRLANWDKICILGIYIKMQPVQNMFTGGNSKIKTVKCTYTMNNVNPGDANVPPEVFDAENIRNKQVFTFNSNEAFTIYVPAPTTMDLSSPVVHKSKTWWSLTDLQQIYQDGLGDDSEENDDGNNDNDNNGGNDNEMGRGCQRRERKMDDEDSSEDLPVLYQIGSPYDAANKMHAGRIYLQADGDVTYNVTINYKVALKG